MKPPPPTSFVRRHRRHLEDLYARFKPQETADQGLFKAVLPFTIEGVWGKGRGGGFQASIKLEVSQQLLTGPTTPLFHVSRGQLSMFGWGPTPACSQLPPFLTAEPFGTGGGLLSPSQVLLSTPI